MLNSVPALYDYHEVHLNRNDDTLGVFMNHHYVSINALVKIIDDMKATYELGIVGGK